MLQYFLLDANKELWSKILELANANNNESDKILKQYVLEAQRLTTSQRNLRVVAENITIDGQTFNKGDAVVCLFVSNLFNFYQPIYLFFRSPSKFKAQFRLTRSNFWGSIGTSMQRPNTIPRSTEVQHRPSSVELHSLRLRSP